MYACYIVMHVLAMSATIVINSRNRLLETYLLDYCYVRAYLHVLIFVHMVPIKECAHMIVYRNLILNTYWIFLCKNKEVQNSYCLYDILLKWLPPNIMAHDHIYLKTALFVLCLNLKESEKLTVLHSRLTTNLKWLQKLDRGCISSINIENISKLAQTFSLCPEEYLPWLVKCCNSHELSKTLFFLVLLQSLKMLKMGKHASHFLC